MKSARISKEKLTIKTYKEPEREEMPIFCENRMHQLTSGRTYPNKVVTAGALKQAENVEYDAVHMENDYIDMWILPQIGGRIFSAMDKTNGYDFFYRQHVIKPALIGCLGSWISGGVEFNWPFHHRASGFAPTDYRIEECDDGSVICWVSEHDPFERMTGTIGIVLRPDATFIETRCRLTNRTELQHSFHWWENAAVAINDNYQFFFPKDVSHVKYHYRGDYGAWPVMGDTTYIGHDMRKATDISWLKNSRDTVSYFACDSDYDFFGGYDHGKNSGVVHIADHHISPGKKMFSWGWNQREQGWEKALTDEDGAYCELMAGSYTNDQPDFTWLEPYETKEFSQYWYPIREIGTPDYASLELALKMDDSALRLEATENLGLCHVHAENAEGFSFDADVELNASSPVSLEWTRPRGLMSITVKSGNTTYVNYTEPETDRLNIPEPFNGVPNAYDLHSAEDLYLAGLHLEQYRDDKRMPDVYWLEALKREPDHIASLLALAGYYYKMYRFETAKEYAERAIAVRTRYNSRLTDGEAYYIYALILEALGRENEAYDYFYKAAWCAPAVAKAMTKIACLDLKRGNIAQAIHHAKWALKHDSENALALAVLIIAGRQGAEAAKVPGATGIGDMDVPADLAEKYLERDPANILIRYLSGDSELIEEFNNHPAQQLLDIVWELVEMGGNRAALELIEAFKSQRPEEIETMVLFTEAWLKAAEGEDVSALLREAENAPMGLVYPCRREELKVLAFARENGSSYAAMLLGDMLYDKRHYEEAKSLFEERAADAPEDYIALRNLAVAYYSHFNRGDEALELMKKALKISRSEQVLYETVVLMDMLCSDPADKVSLMTEYDDIITRSDVFMEKAKAYSQLHDADSTIDILTARNYDACEGGEALMGTQYMFALALKGAEAYKNGEYEKALSFFRKALVIPDNLGIGFGDEFPLIKLKFLTARSLDMLDRRDEAEELYRWLLNIPLEKYQNGGEPALPYFQACAAKRLGIEEKGRNLMNKYRRDWTAQLKVKDTGFFDFTHYFISFVQDAASKRRAYYEYLLAYTELYEGHTEKAEKMFKESYAAENDNLYAGFFADYGYLFN